MPRIVRRAPLSERIKAFLDPYDFLLWLSEELNDDSYDEWLKIWALPIGIGLNILFILSRGASRPNASRGGDDVFGDFGGKSSNGWVSWFAAFLMHSLTLLCCLNAFYTFFRKRHYRMFEQPVDEVPATPSAHRVRVDSSPMSSSPLRYLQQVVSSATASSRAYPDAEREVWELSIWDPKSFNLTLFTLFSPGHLLLYYSLLPPAPLDPRPSSTVLMAVAFATLLSVQLSFLKSSFSQQAKDSSLVHGEVLNEYDTKFVRPSLQRPVRDVGIQTRESAMTPRGTKTREVDVYTPTTIVNRGFRTNPNPNYASQYDPDHLAAQPDTRRTSALGMQRNISASSITTPATDSQSQTNGCNNSAFSRPSTAGTDFSSPLKPHHEKLRERAPAKGSDGYLGVHSHAASPLRKAASSSYLTARPDGVQDRRGGSPLKRVSTPGGGIGSGFDRGGRRRETDFGRF